jgi:TonB family protein
VRIKPQPLPPQPKHEEIPAPPVPKPVVTQPVRPAPVRMGVFEASHAHATVKDPARTVQTGGFGSSEGVASRSLGPANVPRLGGFDQPEGPGHGNGRNGAHGTPGMVASAGFGNGIATGRPGRPHGAVTGVSFGSGVSQGREPTGHGNVQASGFDAQPAPASGRHAAPAHATVTPLEVLYKPRPAYTQEARDLHLEGTVLLSAVFPANGPVRVVRVLRGLGHGLDQSAIRAAEQIRFKPKQQNGQPVDTTATLAIVFQLAY